MMVQTQKHIFNIMASTNANRFIYYFKRIPWIGKKLPDSVYGHIGLKKKTAVLAAVLKILGEFFGKAVFIGLFMILPVMLIEKTPSSRYASYLHIFFMLNFIGSFLTSSIFESGKNKYICIRLMRMNAKSYIVSTALFHFLTDFLYFLPFLVISSVWLGGSALQGFLLTILSVGFSLIGETFHLLVYSKTGVILSKKMPFVISVSVFLCLAAAYVPIFLHNPLAFGHALFNPACILVFLVLSALCVNAIMKFDQYHDIAAITLKASDFSADANQIIGEARFSDVAMREKEFTNSELKSNRFESKKGFAYLNAIFFERHKRLFIRPILIRLSIITVLFLAAVVATLLMPESVKELDGKKDSMLPVFVFILYFASIGERACKAMFYNCDISLLRYSFYRDKSAILSNFKVRLLRVAGLNLIVAAAISAAVVGLTLIFKLNWPVVNILSFVLSILFLSLFFSVHHLFLYYVFQPYTTDLGMKNPFYSIMNFAVYLICYFCSRIKSPPSYFALIVLASTIVYIVVALISVYKYSPKIFRVK